MDHFPRLILLRTECDENKFPLSLTGGPEQLCVWHLYASSHMRGFMWLRSWRWEVKVAGLGPEVNPPPPAQPNREAKDFRILNVNLAFQVKMKIHLSR